jgi:hypothetical protein
MRQHTIVRTALMNFMLRVIGRADSTKEQSIARKASNGNIDCPCYRATAINSLSQSSYFFVSRSRICV